MLQVFINGHQIEINTQIRANANIENVTIINPPGRKEVPKPWGKVIANWMYDITQRATGNIIYNGSIISKDSIKKYK